jgi:ribonucleotide reductase alpha subunit
VLKVIARLPYLKRPSNAVISPNALTVLEKRYLIKAKTGRGMEMPEEMFGRVARAVAQAERAYDPDAEKVMKTLRGLDDVACVRFASVYRRFVDVESLAQEIEELIERKKREEGP